MTGLCPLRRKDQHLGRGLPLTPLLRGLRQRRRMVAGIVQRLQQAPVGTGIGLSNGRGPVGVSHRTFFQLVQCRHKVSLLAPARS